MAAVRLDTIPTLPAQDQAPAAMTVLHRIAWPIEPLGRFHAANGTSFILFRDRAGEVQCIPTRSLNKRSVLKAFDQHWPTLQALWPGGKSGPVDWVRAAHNLIAACAARGVVDPEHYGLKVWVVLSSKGCTARVERIRPSIGRDA